MCGINGIVRFDGKSVERDPIQQMNDAILHRGPDGEGVWISDDAQIAFGHRRLSIIDLSQDANQPMHSNSGRYSIVFNGEIYNFQRIKKELPDYKFSTTSDTEVLLAAIETFGLENTLHKLIGMFAFALWDHREQRVFIVRDRVGIKPLYYFLKGDLLVFSSDLKAFHKVSEISKEFDFTAIQEFLQFSYINRERSIYQHIKKLLPGHILSFAKSGSTVESFWSLSDIAERASQQKFQGSFEEAQQELNSLVEDSIQLRMISDVPLGTFLSGGIDSSFVTANAQKLSSDPVKTFTIGFKEWGFDEAVYAKKISEHLGTDHTEVYLEEKDILNTVEKISQIYTEPFADSSQLPTYLVSKVAREKVTVVLSGDGGDELFCGYNRYLFLQKLGKTLKALPKPAKKVLASSLQTLGEKTWEVLFQGLSKLHPFFNKSAPGEKIYKVARLLESGNLSEAFESILSKWKDPSVLIQPEFRQERQAIELNQFHLEGDLQKVILHDSQNYLVDDILTKVDRASMAVSLEARVPLLDHRIVEFAWSLPFDFKYREGDGKFILRKNLEQFVPKSFFERPKMGFSIPINQWLRNSLKESFSHFLSAEIESKYQFLDFQPIQQAWNEHLQNKADHGHKLWNVFVLLQWLENNG